MLGNQENPHETRTLQKTEPIEEFIQTTTQDVGNEDVIMNQHTDEIKSENEQIIKSKQNKRKREAIDESLYDELIPENMRSKRLIPKKDQEILSLQKCTACSKKFKDFCEIKVHACLEVPICAKCFDTYNCGEDGKEEYCRWCGDGGRIIACDKCSKSFCSGCIRRNLGPKKLKEILENPDNAWFCLLCDQTLFDDLKNKNGWKDLVETAKDFELIEVQEKEMNKVNYEEYEERKENQEEKVDNIQIKSTEKSTKKSTTKTPRKNGTTRKSVTKINISENESNNSIMSNNKNDEPINSETKTALSTSRDEKPKRKPRPKQSKTPNNVIRARIVHEDISQGKESIPIPCVNEVNDDILPLNFVYITDYVPGANVELTNNPNFLVCCSCEDNCLDPKKCECIQIMGSKQAYNSEGKILEPKLAIYECNYKCSCHRMRCKNRIVGRGPQLRLQVYRCKENEKGWGVRCLDPIPAGTFITDYLGEIILESDAEKRGLKKGDEYLFGLDLWAQDVAREKLEKMGLKEGFERFPPEFAIDSNVPNNENKYESMDTSDGTKSLNQINSSSNSEIPNQLEESIGKTVTNVDLSNSNNSILTFQTLGKAELARKQFEKIFEEVEKESGCCIDAKWYGNIARFLNHSCDPNLIKQAVFVESHDVRVPRLAFFALWDIPPLQELTYDYGYRLGCVEGKQMPCKCGSKNCEGRMY